MSDPIITIITSLPPATATTPVVFTVVGGAGFPIRRMWASVAFPGVVGDEVIYNGSRFGAFYTNGINARASVANGYQVTILRDGGWPAGAFPVAASFTINAVDTHGNGETPADTVWVVVGDSNAEGVVQLATSSVEFGLDLPDDDINFQGHYAIGVNDPPTFINMDTGPLRPHTDGGIPLVGFYAMVGKVIIARVGVGAWMSLVAISGLRLADAYPGSTYMLATTGKNFYNTWVDWVKAFAAGRRIGGVIANWGTNDATLTGDASAFGSRWSSFVAQARTDFGNPGLPFVMIRTHSATDPATHNFLSVVRTAQDAAPLSIPNTRTVHIDKQVKLAGDLLHYLNDSSPLAGDLAATALLDIQGYPRASVVGLPDVVAWAPGSWGSGNPTPCAPADIRHNDLLVLVVFTGGTVASTLATPAGWTARAHADTTGFGGGSVSGIVERCALFTLPVTQTLLDANDNTIPDVTVTVTGSTENFAQIFCVRSSTGTLPVYVDSSAFIDPTFGTTSSATGVTPTANARILGWPGGFAGGINAGMTATNGALVALTKVKDVQYQMPDTGFQLCGLTKAMHGSGPTGNWTINTLTNMVIAMLSMAVQ